MFPFINRFKNFAELTILGVKSSSLLIHHRVRDGSLTQLSPVIQTEVVEFRECSNTIISFVFCRIWEENIKKKQQEVQISKI